MLFLSEGCNSTASYSKKIENDLWLCAFDKELGGTWEEAYTACNQARNFHLSTVTSFTARGAPADTNIEKAMAWADSYDFDYVLTGQPVEGATWSSDKTNCIDNRLGYISPGNRKSTSTGWSHLLDGNGEEGRSWNARNCAQANLKLISLCQDASSITDSCLTDNRWRVGNLTNCVYSSGVGKKIIS